MKLLDDLSQKCFRNVARNSSRRGFLQKFGKVLIGAALIPALPVARGVSASSAEESKEKDFNNPNSCDYWRHCAIDGFVCSCCGGSSSQCPPGTEASQITWIGTCYNPNDQKNYIISYNDCCGKSVCGRCYCHRNEGDTPHYRPFTSNDTQWCVGTEAGVVYNCSLAVVIGQA